MLASPTDQYSYSRTTCWENCSEALHRFMICRIHVPSGFFVCRMLDLQAFTMATLLLLMKEPSRHCCTTDTASSTNVVNMLVDSVKSLFDKVATDFAREAAAALSTLMDLKKAGKDARPRHVALQIPLLGTVHSNMPSQSQHNDTGIRVGQVNTTGAADPGIGSRDMYSTSMSMRTLDDQTYLGRLAPSRFLANCLVP